MKKLLLMGTFALLSTTLFSCTADDYEDQQNKKVEKPAYADGPGDLPITVPPPPIKD
jgi:hypothetical protein